MRSFDRLSRTRRITDADPSRHFCPALGIWDLDIWPRWEGLRTQAVVQLLAWDSVEVGDITKLGHRYLLLLQNEGLSISLDGPDCGFCFCPPFSRFGSISKMIVVRTLFGELSGVLSRR